jgi:PAS domain S-box-containing protein
MRALVEARDWAVTPLGAREAWSPSLKLAVDIVLASAFPMALRWGPDFVLIYNDAYRPILGDKHPWALGRPAREAWSEVWDQIAPAHDAILQGLAPAIFAEDILLRIQRHGTDWEDARFTLGYSPVDDPTTPMGIGGVFVTAVEITDRVAAEAALRASEESAAENRSFLADLLRSSSEAFYAVDRDGGTTLCNQAFLRMTGFTHEDEVIGRKLHDIIHHTHPDGRHYEPADCPIYRCAAGGEAAHVDDEFFFRVDGSRFPVEYWVSPIHRAGVHQGAICTFNDISERRAAAETLKQLNATLERRVAEQSAERDRLWQTSQDLIAVVGEDGIFRAANPAWTKVLGWAPEEVVGQSHLAFNHPDDRTGADAALDRALGGPLTGHLARALHKDGGFRWISWIASPENGLVYATGRDVTAERQAAADLLLAQEALRQSQKMEAVGQLTGGIAHDFNNMLAVVIGSLDLVGRRLAGAEPRIQRYLDAASDAARRGALLTQRLLAFSRQQPLQPEPLEINRLVSGMSDLLRHSIGAEVRLETVLAGGVWRTHADPNQLENVILNLAVNARDAMPDGGRLTIETQNAHLDERYCASHPGLTPGHYVMIAVSDTGDGMSPEVVEKAFDPFFTTKAVGKGTGLGLSQVYGFVKQSGGHVKIYSEPGQGTTIKIYLPRLTGALAQDDPEPADAAPLRGDQGELILVVEDEAAVRRFSVEALTELGYRVLDADGAEAALRLLDAHPDIVLLFTDVVMPDVNGARLAQEVRRRRPDLRILFTTGYTRNAVVHNGVLDPGVEMIGKPFSIDALAAKVRTILDTCERPETPPRLH